MVRPHLDSEITRWFVDHRTPTWNNAMRIVTWLGSSAVIIPLAIVVVVALLVGRRRWLASVRRARRGRSIAPQRPHETSDRARPPTRRHTTPATPRIGVPIRTLNPSRRDLSSRSQSWSRSSPVAGAARRDLDRSDAHSAPRRRITRLPRRALGHRRTRRMATRKPLGRRPHRRPRASRHQTGLNCP